MEEDVYTYTTRQGEHSPYNCHAENKETTLFNPVLPTFTWQNNHLCDLPSLSFTPIPMWYPCSSSSIGIELASRCGYEIKVYPLRCRWAAWPVAFWRLPLKRAGMCPLPFLVSSSIFLSETYPPDKRWGSMNREEHRSLQTLWNKAISTTTDCLTPLVKFPLTPQAETPLPPMFLLHFAQILPLIHVLPN